MKTRSRVLFLAAALLLFEIALVFSTTQTAQNQNRVLSVLSYGSFAASWGAGKVLAEEFQKYCGCRVEIIDGGDSGTLLERLRLERNKFDVVIGLDQYWIGRARAQLDWQTLPPDLRKSAEGLGALSEFFLPVDWAPMAFIYREGEIEPPRKIEDLLSARFRKSIVIQDPRTSSPGLQFVQWIYVRMGDQAEDFLRKLQPNILTWAPSWSAGYGLFQKGDATLVFSYRTSPIYHWVETQDLRYQAAQIEGYSPVQWEIAGSPAQSPQPELALEFLQFLLNKSAQKHLMEKNYMFPMSADVVKGTPFEKLWVSPPRFVTLDSPEPALAIWKKVFVR